MAVNTIIAMQAAKLARPVVVSWRMMQTSRGVSVTRRFEMCNEDLMLQMPGDGEEMEKRY